MILYWYLPLSTIALWWHKTKCGKFLKIEQYSCCNTLAAKFCLLTTFCLLASFQNCKKNWEYFCFHPWFDQLTVAGVWSWWVAVLGLISPDRWWRWNLHTWSTKPPQTLLQDWKQHFPTRQFPSNGQGPICQKFPLPQILEFLHCGLKFSASNWACICMRS